ncbi:amidase domain-containing protein [Bacillus sp. 03113]|uniref:amidase domain-containing protein n=1 Tax=Bacillus sp. 03113 TaxID=2578211 RepID=UPI0011426794|nr:amidase domain-containing protein [Bacillus sp. 03113]
MKKQLHNLLQSRVQQLVSNSGKRELANDKMIKKNELLQKRSGQIVKAKACGRIDQISSENEVWYHVHFQYLIKQKNFLYIEEEIEYRKGMFKDHLLIEDKEVYPFDVDEKVEEEDNHFEEISEERKSYYYNRLKAVQYAEKWWNSYNPAYKKFDVDCTNFISQCLHAGGAPMRGYPNQGTGWWMRSNQWSYSWTVANSLKRYLMNSKIGLQAKTVKSPMDLKLGDVICYDFQGDGRFDHSTIVTGKDANGEPLVNAHTTNSRLRYWSYEDSTAYTPNIRYMFFTILDNETT